MPTIRYEQEGQQVGCIEGANLRRATLDSGLNLKGLTSTTAVGRVSGTCVMEVVEGLNNLLRAVM